MTANLLTVQGTANKVDATTLGASPNIGPSTGQVTMSLDATVQITNSLTASDISANDLSISSSFTNPWSSNPSANGSCIQNDGSGGGGIVSWTKPPVLFQNTWNTTGPNLRFDYGSGFSTTISNPLIYFTTTQGNSSGTWVTPGNVVYMNINLQALFGLLSSGSTPVDVITTFATDVNSGSSVPCPPSDLVGTGDVAYLGTLPILNADTGLVYNSIVVIVNLQGNGFQCNALAFLPGGSQGGALAPNFALANTSGYSFGYNQDSSIIFQSATFVYSI